MKMKKIVATGSALALTAAVAVGGTLAWLQNSTGPVTNTFTYSNDSNITLDLFEHNAEGDKVKEQEYNIVPGATVKKDPTLSLTTTTDSYLYFEIKDGLNAALKGVADYTITSDWAPLMSEDTQVVGPNGGLVYVYNNGTATTTVEKNIFPEVTFDSSVMTNENTAGLDGTTITLYGYAVQEDAGETALAAWTTANFQAASQG